MKYELAVSLLILAVGAFSVEASILNVLWTAYVVLAHKVSPRHPTRRMLA